MQSEFSRRGSKRGMMRVACKPGKYSRIEGVTRDAECATVPCVGLPQASLGWVVGLYQLGVGERDVLVRLAVNQQDRH